MTATLTIVVCVLHVVSVLCMCPSTVHPHVRGFEHECRYRCNCKHNEQCDIVTGECPHGCLQGWMGPACQYRNLAAAVSGISQYPSQSERTYDAIKAVDSDETTCSKTGLAPGQRWLRLDMNASVYLVGFVIKISRTQRSHFRGFSVEVGNSTNVWSLCYQHDAGTDGNVTMEVTCVKPLVGRYVQISLAKGETRDLSLCELEIFGDQFQGFVVTRSKDGVAYSELFTDTNPTESPTLYQPMSANFSWPVSGRYIQVNRYNVYILVVCELEIFADCPFGLCGWACNETCMCSSQTTGTNKILGTCPYGCIGRWTGLNGKCNRECNFNHWGPSCERTCGYCLEPCNVVNGICPGSCQIGYQQPYCTQVCTDGRYGTDCLSTCGNCRNNTFCDKVTGQCTTGCKPGYKAPHCKEICNSWTYGENCASFCGNCRFDEVCHHVDGTCPRGCATGYLGEKCKTREPMPPTNETIQAHDEILEYLEDVNNTANHNAARLGKLDDIDKKLSFLQSKLVKYEHNDYITSKSNVTNKLESLEKSLDLVHDDIRRLQESENKIQSMLYSILSVSKRNSSTVTYIEDENN